MSPEYSNRQFVQLFKSVAIVYKPLFVSGVMAGIVAVIVKIMPQSLEENLNKIKASAEENLKEDGARNISFEVKEVAFGLKVLFVRFAWPEEKDTSIYEDNLAKIEGVSSVDTEDYRRAFG